MRLRHRILTTGEIVHDDRIYLIGPNGTLLDPATMEPAEIPQAVATAILAAVEDRVEPLKKTQKGAELD